MSGNIRAGNLRARSIHQEWYARFATGQGLGSEEDPYEQYLSLSVHDSYHTILVMPWKCSLVGVVWVAQPLFRVEAGTLKVEVGYMEYPDCEFSGWDWGPQNCIVTPATMEEGGNVQWEAWTFDNGQYVVPAKAGIGAQMALVGCKLGDGSTAVCQVQLIFEPTK